MTDLVHFSISARDQEESRMKLPPSPSPHINRHMKENNVSSDVGKSVICDEFRKNAQFSAISDCVPQAEEDPVVIRSEGGKQTL